MKTFLVKVLSFSLLLFNAADVACRCPSEALATLPYVLEHAVWRGWHQAVIYARDMPPGCHWALVRLMKCLAVNGVASVLDRIKGARIHNKLGVLILAPSIRSNNTGPLKNLIKKLDELGMNTASYDWLLAMRSEKDFKYLNEILNASSIRFDQNIMAAFPFSESHRIHSSIGVCDRNFDYKNLKYETQFTSRTERKRYMSYNCNYRNRDQDPNCVKTEYERNYYRATERFKNLTRNKTYKRSGSILPLFQSGLINFNYSRQFIMINISKFSLRQQVAKWRNINHFYVNSNGVHLVQYYKVRLNSTLYAHFLGGWTVEQSMSQMATPYSVEERDFLGEDLYVGRCNMTGDSTGVEEEGPSSPALLDDVLLFLNVRLNATSVTKYYSKLGFRSYEGVWTGLLGALQDHSVDVALEPVTAHPSRRPDLHFIFSIAETMCNIYIRHKETSTVRDIFLAPFSPRLVVCVVAVAVVAALAVMLISRATPDAKKARPMESTEALIWSTAILCQQGGTCTPNNPAASILLIVCLLFAVVTYNAYAAFITSVLSVRVASLDTVAAVLHSPDFKIGYIRNGADQMYLMSTKDAQLNAFYIRGYSDAENLVSTAEEGLARAASQDYAFFTDQRAARTTLRSLSQARGRCSVRELPVHSTRAHLAFPLPQRSPYARPILISLLQLRSGGVLDRLRAALVPAMPRCASPAGFASARAADVRSALILLLIGLITAFVLGIGEYSWKNRKEIRSFLLSAWRRLFTLITKW